MGLFALLVWLALIGCGTWALVTYIPMTDGFKRLIPIVAIIVAVVLVLTAFGIMPIGDVSVPRLR